MKSLLDRFVEWLCNESAEAPFTADVRINSVFGDDRGAENICRVKSPKIVVAFGNGPGVVVLEGEDEVTGLWYRKSYVYSEKDGLIDHIVLTYSTTFKPSDSTTIRSPVTNPDYLESEFGFRPYSASEAPPGMTLEEAEALLSADISKPLVYQFDDEEISYDRRGALVNDKQFYIPYTWIGCVGYLVDRTTSKVMALGSGIAVETQIWALYRGIRDDHNNLEILAVHDMVELESLLRQVMGNYRFRTEVKPRIGTLPCLVENLRLYPVCEYLRRAEINNWYRFRIVAPKSDGAGE